MTTATHLAPTGLLRGPAFDLIFIAGLAAVAITTGLVVTARPGLFWPILILDLWLLGYHHVIATYTRLAFDRESFREHRALVLYLPLAVMAGVTAIALSAGLWLLVSVYLYWQWFHYTRQSEGISKAYAGRARDRDTGNPRLARLAFYAVPIAGILNVSARAPERFLFMPVKTLPVPDWLAFAAVIAAAGLCGLWLAEQLRILARGRLAPAYFGYMASHFAIFSVAYIGLSEINYGWLAVNLWHNAQYILFVWLFNNRRFNGKVDPQRVLLSTISQDRRFPLYIAACLTLSTVVYTLMEGLGVDALGNALGVSTAVATVIIYQTLNFHHYVVDSLIWKLRKPALRSKLGLT